MKNIGFFLLISLSAFLSSCIGSEYIASNKDAFVNDDQIVGTWKFIPPIKKSAEEMELPIEKIIFAKSSSLGTYSLVIRNKPQEGVAEPTPDKPLEAYVSSLKGTKIVSFGGEDNGAKGYCYFKYKLDGKQLKITMLFEKEIYEAKAKGERYDASKAKPTKFMSEKAFRDFVIKNINNKIYWSEELIFVKE